MSRICPGLILIPSRTIIKLCLGLSSLLAKGYEEGTAWTLDSEDEVYRALFQLAFDVKGKRKSMLGEGRTNGIPFKTHEIDDYAAGKKYTVTNGKCVVSVLKVEMVSCIPSDAKLLMSTFVGYGDKKIDVDMYSFSFNGANITMSVTKDSCVPVSQHVILPGAFIDIGYMGMTSGIRNTTVFNIPKPCQQIGTFEHQQNVSTLFYQI
ncbi:unnamed protein product [Mytilus edulis]|uniref:Uncharacterized protein n=1 Tax=Mytilus edulis TaxID=6550 RepID=A0A8S3R0X6_MYTED|nr:unnamed protein product [Mytilus edulis]